MDPTGVMGRRIVAWLIDFAIAIVIFLISFGIFGDSIETFFDPCDSTDSSTLCLFELSEEMADSFKAIRVLFRLWLCLLPSFLCILAYGGYENGEDLPLVHFGVRNGGVNYYWIRCSSGLCWMTILVEHCLRC